jgi:egghead protein (zeste-white 4 protein)
MLTVFEICWLFGVPAAAFSWYHVARNVGKFIPPRAELPPPPLPKIIFSIAARKLTPSLQGPVDSIVKSCAEASFSNYEVKLVVDVPGAKIEGAEIILVPLDFTCMSRYKARALHYALRHLPDSKDAWTLHLDEDTLVTPQCVTRLLDYIGKGGNPVANGPTVFPYDGNILTFYAEAQRQWTFYWLMDQEKSSTVHWLNGSNLLIRSDIEHAVGWDFVNCFISEDARFGYEATKKLGKIFGWHGGLTIEKPPATIGSIIKQRTRWFYGSILNLRYVPRARLPRRIYSITAWTDGLFLTLFLFVLLTGLGREFMFSTPYTTYALAATAVFWVGRYQLGVYQNLRYTPISRLKKLLLHLGAIPLAPFVDLLCNLPTVLTLFKRPKSFEITSKG